MPMNRSAFGTMMSKPITGGRQRMPRHARRRMLASKGRFGDSQLAHVNPEEAELLKARGGAGTVNPETGFREFYMGGSPGTLGQRISAGQQATRQLGGFAASPSAASPMASQQTSPPPRTMAPPMAMPTAGGFVSAPRQPPTTAAPMAAQTASPQQAMPDREAMGRQLLLSVLGPRRG